MVKNKLSENPDVRKNWILSIKEIAKDASLIINNAKFFKNYIEIVSKNPQVQNSQDFHRWIIRIYTDSISAGIRRHMSEKVSHHSLRRLLMDIKKDPQHLTKEWYSNLFDPEPGNSLGISEFESKFGKNDYFDPKIAKEDVKKLDSLGKKIQDYVDTYVAHLSKTKLSNIPNYKDLDAFLIDFKKLVDKYYLLLTATGGSPVSVPQSDWSQIFTIPWISK